MYFTSLPLKTNFVTFYQYFGNNIDSFSSSSLLSLFVKISAKKGRSHILSLKHPSILYRLNLDKREVHMFSSLGNKGKDNSETEHFLI